MMNSKNTHRGNLDLRPRSSRSVFFWVGALLMMVGLTQARAAGTKFDLQGQSKGSCSWLSGNLQGWHDQDYIPCRVLVTGRALQDQTITLTFPSLAGAKPGFENLLCFMSSSNVTITSAPVLSSPAGADFSYTFKIDYTGSGAGSVQFLARLAEGAHQNPGSSLMLRGNPSSMGNLQISKPAAHDVANSFGIRQDILRCLNLPNEGFEIAFPGQSNRLYCIQYSSDLKRWNTAQSVITGTGGWTRWADKGQPDTQSNPASQSARFYRLFQLPYVLNQANDCLLAP